MSPWDRIQELIGIYEERLHRLRKQQAIQGISVDPGVSIEIQNIEAKIQELRTQLVENIKQDNNPLDSSLNSDLEIESPYGTVSLNSKFYIERVNDHNCWRHLHRNRAVTLFVQAPRQMGKSSLMHRMLARATNELGRQSVYIDFQKFPTSYLTKEDDFLIEFCLMIGEALGIEEAVDDYWRGARTSIRKCSRYVSEYIIPKISEPIILAMDEIERMLESPFRHDFFAMLRVWHNERAVDENFARMSLFLSSSIEPYLLIDTPYQSPFNVAMHSLLLDFTPEQVEELNRQHSSPLNSRQVSDLIDLVAGHPFLIRLTLYLITIGEFDFDTILARAIDTDGPFDEHLKHRLLRVIEKPELKQALILVCREQICENQHFFYELSGLGLVKRSGQQVIPYNNLYARYFQEHLYA